MYSVIFVHYSLLLFFSLFLFFVVSFFAKISTGGLGRGQTGPTQAAVETRDETRGSTGECHINVCSPLYLFLLLTPLLFHCLQYNNRRPVCLMSRMPNKTSSKLQYTVLAVLALFSYCRFRLTLKALHPKEIRLLFENADRTPLNQHSLRLAVR